MRLAILLGLISFWTGGQALAYPAESRIEGANVAGSSALFSINAQTVATSTPTPATLATPTVSDPVGPVIATPIVSSVTATASVSVTAAVEVATATSTPTPTPEGPPPPTIAVPVVEPESRLRLNPFDANFLLSAPRPPMGPFAWGCFALMVALLGVSGYFYAVKRPQWKKTNTPLYRAANRWSPMGLWVAILGLLLVLFRIVSLDFFNLRFWLYVWMLALLGLGAWFFYWYRTGYRKELVKFQKTQRARQYMPGGSVKTPVRLPERTGSKPAQSSRPTQKPPGSTTPTTKPSRDKKRGKDR